MEWSGCEQVEVSGDAWLIRGSRISADEVLERYRSSISVADVLDRYSFLPREQVLEVLTYGIERIGMDAKTLLDWSGCEFVERVPGRCSGAPTILGTRIFPDTIAQYIWSGATVEEIQEDYPGLSRHMIEGLMAYVSRHDVVAA